MPSLDKLIEWLKQQDETAIIELLDLRAPDIINRFMDVIQQRKDMLDTEYEEFSMDDDTEEDEYEGLTIKEPDDEWEEYEEDSDEEDLGPPWDEEED